MTWGNTHVYPPPPKKGGGGKEKKSTLNIYVCSYSVICYNSNPLTSPSHVQALEKIDIAN